MKQLCQIIFALSFFLPSIPFAQTRNLDTQLKAYEVKFKNLMATRGLSYKEGKVNQSKIEDVVREYTEDLFGEPQPGFALLFYHFENDTLYHWLFDHHKLAATATVPLKVDSLITLENTLKFSMAVDEMMGASRSVIKNENKKYRLRTQQSVPIISGILFPKPISAQLIGKKYLIILPILNLSSFPLAVLKPWGEDKGMLIDSLSYSFAHNFTQFFQSVEKNAMGYDLNYHFKKDAFTFTVKQPVIIGNPLFHDPCTSKLEQLPGAEKEATAVARQLNTTAWIGPAAHKDSITAKMVESNFVYLSTHGWADPDAPLDSSFIALYQPEGCGFLTPREIQSMNLQNKPIVILSACQTGLGMIHEAGIVGLARGFLKAGAQSVLMSLWNVNDAETEKLMSLFVQELQRPHPFFPAEHWRQAVLKYKSDSKKDAINWSAFQNFGVPYRLIGPVSLQGIKN